MASTMVFSNATTAVPETESTTEIFSADFSELQNGDISTTDTSTVNYLQSKFAFYYFQSAEVWPQDNDKKYNYSFERPNVNGYVVNDTEGRCWRLPDTAVPIVIKLDGLQEDYSVDGLYTPTNFWNQVPTWSIDNEGYISCTAYSGQNATLFRSANLMYLRGNTNTGLANIKNFNLEMDFKFKETTEDGTIVEGKDSLAVLFDASVAGNVRYENQLMFSVAPNGQYYIGKPVTWGETSYDKQLKDSNENVVTFERNKKYHLSMRRIGSCIVIKITDVDNTVVASCTENNLPTVLSGVGGNLAITGSNAGAKYANIELTRLDDNGTAYDYSNNANGYGFGVTAREYVNWVSAYWTEHRNGVLMNSIFTKDSSLDRYWSNYSPDGIMSKRMDASGEDTVSFGSSKTEPSTTYLAQISEQLGDKFSVYHDAMQNNTNYFAKAPYFHAHHAGSGINDSKYGQMYLSASGLKSVALFAYLDGAKDSNSSLLGQTMSLAPKTSSGDDIQTKNFRTQFNTSLPSNTNQAISLSFRSQAAGAMIGTDNAGYSGKVTLLLNANGYYLDCGNGEGELELSGTLRNLEKWDSETVYEGDVSVYAEAVGTTLKLKVTAANGTVLLDKDDFTIPDGNSGYIYYSAVNAMGNFYSINCDRLDADGNVADWDTQNISYTIGDLNNDGEVDILDLVRLKKIQAGVVAEYSFGAANLYEDKYIDANDLTVMRKYLLGIVEI